MPHRSIERSEHTSRYLQFYLTWVRFADEFDSYLFHTTLSTFKIKFGRKRLINKIENTIISKIILSYYYLS
jgi:hypothetical protein